MSNMPAVLIGVLAGLVFGSSIVHWLLALMALFGGATADTASRPAVFASLLAATVASGGFWMALLLVFITWVAIANPPYAWLPWFTTGIYVALLLLAILALSVASEPSKQFVGRLLSGLRKKRVYLTFTVCVGILASVVAAVLMEDAGIAVLLGLVSIPASYLTGLYIWQFMPPENDADRLHYKPKRRLPK